jgi:hypothetical protein
LVRQIQTVSTKQDNRYQTANRPDADDSGLQYFASREVLQFFSRPPQNKQNQIRIFLKLKMLVNVFPVTSTIG